MLVVGRRVIPWMLHYVAHTGSRELFRLAVLAISLGVAFGAAVLFDVSFALGAFFAGMILSEIRAQPPRRAGNTAAARCLRGAVLCVASACWSIPTIAMREPLAAAGHGADHRGGQIARRVRDRAEFGHPTSTALTISASLAQIGEFSFILGRSRRQLALLPAEGKDLVLAGAIVSILLNPVFFAILDRVLAAAGEAGGHEGAGRYRQVRGAKRAAAGERTCANHVVLVGHGRRRQRSRRGPADNAPFPRARGRCRLGRTASRGRGSR